MDTIIYRSHVLICTGTGCVSSGAGKLKEKLTAELEERGLQKEIKVVDTGCHGFCEKGPIVIVYPEGVFYCQVTEDDINDIVEEHLLKGRIVERLLYKEPLTEESIPSYNDIDFYKKQKRIALANCGRINPESINEYIAVGGYEALGKALTEMTPDEVIAEVKNAGLRGRGGAGFPTGLKWELTRREESDKKYLICNADEGDPGAFMDRSLLEGDPHKIIEGMVIAAYAIGADEGYIYVRAEYPLAIHRLEVALEQAAELGLLGENILGSGFNFTLNIKKGAGAFVCGEETALMASIEGKRGMPRPKPPFPSVSGLWGKPTNINNVETFANVPYIISQGAAAYSAIGTEKSKGTKVFALTGKINNTGLVEVPMGITLREIIYDIGGGLRDGKDLKAVQTGGPSGGCIPADLLDLPIDYESLTEVGAMMGSGGMVVMDDSTCMVDVARFFLSFTQSESCGKCTPCREGTKRMLEILDRICAGEGREGDLELLEELGQHIKETSLCQLGGSAPNPVLSTLKYFRAEYEAHIMDKRCPANVCEGMKSAYVIDQSVCIGCTLCTRVCPVDAISGERKKPHYIDPEVCIACGACAEKCPVAAISQG
ncbi:MAG TPA: NADH-quinone oxidoreductase subunit NuoF [Halanaerobiales bacterium]|jgi:NADP-reducing hydrogenase subunit HndC|nr:NADH-quinone oxidoreductase subunit NuoF [Halanaerobiales bacterium]HPZ63571.1 NADH-quinone oxidoreductase subunit NuoF [Halanaerobiales bacterium]HQD04903.1 NADH-quinone oxidoreductase subunit NuoF [Halanaerobiales bacterium]